MPRTEPLLQKFLEEELPFCTVDREHALQGFKFIPGALERVRGLIHSPTEVELRAEALVQCGDTYVCFSDIDLLVRRPGKLHDDKRGTG